MLVTLDNPQLMAVRLLGAGCVPLHSSEEVLEHKVCWEEEMGRGCIVRGTDTVLTAIFSLTLTTPDH